MEPTAADIRAKSRYLVLFFNELKALSHSRIVTRTKIPSSLSFLPVNGVIENV